MIFKPANILSIILACLYIYGGSGFSLAQFCCTSCETKGIEAILSEGCHAEDTVVCNDIEQLESCCSKPEGRHDLSFSSIICNAHCNHVNHCSVESYQFDLDHTVQKIQYEISVIDLLFEPFNYIAAQLPFSTQKTFPDNPLPIYTSRDILLNDSVLRI